MSQNLQNCAKFQKFQLDNLVDFEKCCKTHIFLQRSVPIQPKTKNILPKFCQKLATTLRVRSRRRWPPPSARSGCAAPAQAVRYVKHMITFVCTSVSREFRLSGKNPLKFRGIFQLLCNSAYSKTSEKTSSQKRQSQSADHNSAEVISHCRRRKAKKKEKMRSTKPQE